MSASPKSQKYGNYITKVGYLDIRRKDTRKKLDANSTHHEKKYPRVGASEYIVYHGKHVLEGGLKSHDEAIEKAQGLVDEGVKYSRKKK